MYRYAACQSALTPWKRIQIQSLVHLPIFTVLVFVLLLFIIRFRLIHLFGFHTFATFSLPNRTNTEVVRAWGAGDMRSLVGMEGPAGLIIDQTGYHDTNTIRRTIPYDTLIDSRSAERRGNRWKKRGDDLPESAEHIPG